MTGSQNLTPPPNTASDPIARARLGDNYLTLRQALGLIGLYLPFAFIIFYWLDAKETDLRTSISVYYYSGMRDVFVGSLLAIGVFLFCYRGNNSKENTLSYLAGLGAIGVAICPTARPCEAARDVFFAEDCRAPIPDYLLWPDAWAETVSLVHYGSAGLFFAMVGLLSFYVFVETSDSKKLTGDEKAVRNQIYRWSARVIAICIVLMGIDFGLNHFKILDTDPWEPVFWLEAVAVWAFSISWLVKGEFLSSLR